MKIPPITLQSVFLWMFLLSTLFSTHKVLGQNYTIAGRVIDAETAEAIPFGNVYSKRNPQNGTTTDFEGYYTLKNIAADDSLIVSYIGYVTRTKAPDLSKLKEGVIELNFQLYSSSRNLDEIVVIAGEDPAYPIMRNVLRERKSNNMAKLDAYQYESYVKIELAIDNISEQFGKRKIIKKVQQAIDSVGRLTGEDGKPLIPIFLSESISQVYHRSNPERSTEQLLKTKIDGVGLDGDSHVAQLLGESFQKYNFYNDWLNILSKDFPSPIGSAWKLYYDYYLADSLMLGNDWCYQIEVYPKRKQDLAFEGVLWIESKGFALKQISVIMNPTANINFIEKIKIQQELQKTEAGAWIPIKNRILFDVAEVTNKSAGVLAKIYTSNKDIIINKPLPIKFYKESISVAQNASETKEDYWKIHRHDSLTRSELKAFAMIDTIKAVPIVKTYSNIIEVLSTGYIKTGIVDFGNLVYSGAINDIEGIRLRLGLRTNTDFSKKIELKGYVAYGFDDNRVKYSGRLRYIPSRKNWTEIVVQRSEDILQLAANPSGVVVPGAFAASLNFFGVSTRSPFYKTENNLYIQHDIFKGVTQTVSLRTASHRQIGNHFAYFKNLNPQEMQLERNFNTTELTFETRLAKNEQFFYSGNYRNSLGTRKLPTVTLRYTLGFDEFLGGDFTYHRFEIALEQSLLLGWFGKSYYLLSGTYTPSRIPYPLLEIHLGNRGFFYNFYGYSLMNFMEFASDRHVSLNYEHNFNGLIANRIPLLKKLKWRTFVIANVLYGGLRSENLDLSPDTDTEGNALVKPAGLGNIPYVELGYGITNIFRFFRVNFVHRVTYRGNPDARNFGVFLAVRFEL